MMLTMTRIISMLYTMDTFIYPYIALCRVAAAPTAVTELTTVTVELD